MDGIDDRLAIWLERQPVERSAACIDGLPAWLLDEQVVQ